MIAKVGSLVALLLSVSSARAENEVVDRVEPPSGIEIVPSSDDLLRATGLRPVTRDRLEALVGAGTQGAMDAQLRATTKTGGVGVEVTGNLHDSDLRDRQSATARVEHENARAYGNIGILEQATDTASGAQYGGTWRRGRLELNAFGDRQRLREERLAQRYAIPMSTQGANASLRSGRLELLGLDHEIVVGAGFDTSSGATTTDELTAMAMNPLRRTRRGDHRSFHAYVRDTLHVIGSLDLSGGFVVEDWRNLSAIETIHYGVDQNMDVHFPDVSHMLISPQLGATYRVNDGLAMHANGYRRMRAPTLAELYQPILLDGVLIAANPSLRPESVTGAEIGPELRVGKLEARAVAFYNLVDSPISARTNLDRARVIGVESEASWRPAKPWLASASYSFTHTPIALTPRQRASAMLTYDHPGASLTGALRYVGRQSFENISLGAYTLVDATAARKLKRGIAGFVGVENLLDRRYVGQYAVDTAGAPRTFRVGVRVDSARF